MKSNHRGMLAFFALLTAVALLLGTGVPVFSQSDDGEEQTEEDAALAVGGEEYCTRFTSQKWESATDAGVLLENSARGIRLDILRRGSGLSATLLEYRGQTPCNALQLVMDNHSACSSMQLDVTYTDGTAASCTVSLQAQSDNAVYYAYLEAVEKIQTIRITFNAVSDGEIVLYSVSRVSFYAQLSPDDIYGSVSDCYYDAVSDTIVINGQVHSDSVVRFSGGQISLYRLSPGDTEQAPLNREMTPLATQNIANRFTFSLPASDIMAKNCRYVLLLSDAEGNDHLMCPPVYPTVSSDADAAPTPDMGYQGLLSPSLAASAHCYADAAIVEVALDRLLHPNVAVAETYLFEELYYTFDRTYMDEIKREVLPRLVAGEAVCLRLVVRATADGHALPFTVSSAASDLDPQGLAITLRSTEAAHTYGALLSYLLSGLTASGRTVSGIILGEGIDNSLAYHYAGMIPLQEYLWEVTRTLLFTSNLMRDVCPDAALYLPVTDTVYPNYYTSYDLDGVYATPMLLDGICRMLDDVGLGRVVFYPLLEMHEVPLLPDAALLDAQDLPAISAFIQNEISTRSSENKVTVESILAALAPYQSVGRTGAVLWMPDEPAISFENAEHHALVVALNYIYLYYFFQSSEIDTFFAAMNPAADPLWVELLAKIDTTSSADVLSFSLPYFGLESVYDLPDWNDGSKRAKSTFLYTASMSEKIADIYAGRYLYWNFAAAYGTLKWTAGYGCNALSIDGGSRYGRALLASLDPNGGEILYRFSTPEQLALCDALSLTLVVTDHNGTPVPARLRLTLRGDKERVIAGCEMTTGELCSPFLTGLPLKAMQACRGMALSVEPLQPTDGELRLYLLHIEGRSRQMDDAALEQAILSARSLAETDEQTLPQFGIYPMMLLTGLLLVTIMGVTLSLHASRKRKKLHYIKMTSDQSKDG